jgi:FkbM family methyltransferase
MPTIDSSLETIKEFSIPISCIVDIGVFHETAQLKKQFPSLKHYLFEPIIPFNDQIHSNYQGFDYELHNIAMSDSDGEVFIIGVANDGGDKVTHSSVSDTPVVVSENNVISCEKIKRCSLDSIGKELGIPDNYLLKIDVDGHEVPIINGAEQYIQGASVVIVEASTTKETGNSNQRIIDRINVMIKLGFDLFDIADMAYYGGRLHQVDLVFVRSDIILNDDNLRPIETELFDKDKWFPLMLNI